MTIESAEHDIWVYLGETACDSDGVQWRGVGALVLPGPMPPSAVERALGALGVDPDCKRKAFMRQDE